MMNSTEMPTHYRLKEVLEQAGLFVRAEEFYVVKETPQGYWVRSQYSPAWMTFEQLKGIKCVRWVSKTSTKRYCYPDIKQATKNFTRRKELQENFLRLKLEELELVVKGSDRLKNATAEELVRGVNLGETPSHYRYCWDY